MEVIYGDKRSSFVLVLLYQIITTNETKKKTGTCFKNTRRRIHNISFYF